MHIRKDKTRKENSVGKYVHHEQTKSKDMSVTRVMRIRNQQIVMLFLITMLCKIQLQGKFLTACLVHFASVYSCHKRSKQNNANCNRKGYHCLDTSSDNSQSTIPSHSNGLMAYHGLGMVRSTLFFN